MENILNVATEQVMTPAEKAQRIVDVLRANDLQWRHKAMIERSELAGLEASHAQWEDDQELEAGAGPGMFRYYPYASLGPKRERVVEVEKQADEASQALNFAVDHFLKYVTS
jgi:predicted RNA methylase